MTVDKKLLLSKIAASRRDVMDAEERLTEALRETRRGPRAEKTTITEVVSEAIATLRSARTDLDDLEKVVTADPD